MVYFCCSQPPLFRSPSAAGWCTYIRRHHVVCNQACACIHSSLSRHWPRCTWRAGHATTATLCVFCSVVTQRGLHPSVLLIIVGKRREIQKIPLTDDHTEGSVRQQHMMPGIFCEAHLERGEHLSSLLLKTLMHARVLPAARERESEQYRHGREVRTCLETRASSTATFEDQKAFACSESGTHRSVCTVRSLASQRLMSYTVVSAPQL